MSKDNPEFVNGRELAAQLNVRPAAISNWIARGVLPAKLHPLWVKGPASVTPLWTVDQLTEFRAWYERQSAINDKQRAEKERKRKAWIAEFLGTPNQ